MVSQSVKILVVGVGNPLLRDDGVGVHVIHELVRGFRFSSNVTILDGGTQGLRLLGPLSEHDAVIIVDAVRQGQAPGTVYTMDVQTRRCLSPAKLTAHDWDILDTLAHAEWLGALPPIRIIGVEPGDVSSFDVALSPVVKASLPEVVRRVTVEVELAGGKVELLKCATTLPVETFDGASI